MSRIQQLSKQLVNHIAAGEVIERPASVLKELVENSLDAVATEVSISVSRGGFDNITVRDNGHGVHPEDLVLAISPHATSKLNTLEDLQEIRTLGFRGEALASISAISEFRLTSRVANQEHAWCIRQDGRGSEILSEPRAHPIGTTVEVNQLFFNTPARRKFLRSEQTEYQHLEEVFKRLALSQPSARWQFQHDDKLIFQLSKAQDDTAHLARVGKILGKTFVTHAQSIQSHAGDWSIHGWISDDNFSRSQGDWQYVFLNGRMIRDKVVNHAIRQAMQDRVPIGRHAAWVLYLDINPSLMDVNVHPTKHEVRFVESRMVHDFLLQALRKNTQATVAAPPAIARVQAIPTVARPLTTAIATETLTVIYRFESQYILCQDTQGCILVDYQALRQHQVMSEANQHGSLRGKPLLIPTRLSVTAQLAQKITKEEQTLKQFGFDFSFTGPESLIIRQAPGIFAGVETETLFLHAVDLLDLKRIISNSHFAYASEYLILPTETRNIFEKIIWQRLNSDIISQWIK